MERDKKPTIIIMNQGCIKECAKNDYLLKKLNVYDVSVVEKIRKADYFLYITCAGLGEEIEEFLESAPILDKLSQEQDIEIIITGCVATYFGNRIKGFLEGLGKNPKIKIIEGKDWVFPVVNYITGANEVKKVEDEMAMRTLFKDRDSVYIQFMMEEGCTNRCSFCKMNYIDKPITSVDFDIALKYLTAMVKEKGTKQITLDGENLTIYGIDLYGRQRLHEFLHELAKIEGLERIQVQEIVAGNMYSELLDELANNPKVKTVCLQLETASNRLLKLMNRNYTIEEYDYCVRRLKDAGKFVTTIIMSSFPTERYRDIYETFKYIKERGIYVYDVAKYSDFPGMIPSSKLKQFRKWAAMRRYMLTSRGVTINNFRFLSRERFRQGRLIYTIAREGNPVFLGDMLNAMVYPKTERFNDLTPGTIIDEAPSGIFIKKTPDERRLSYKID